MAVDEKIIENEIYEVGGNVGTHADLRVSKAALRRIDRHAKAGKKLVPIAPQNAQYQVIEDYNAAHPDHPVKLEASENFQVADAYTWVLEGRYDGYFSIDKKGCSVNTSETTQVGKEDAERGYQLIMKDKRRLLSLDCGFVSIRMGNAFLVLTLIHLL